MNGGLVQGAESFVPQEIGAKGEPRVKQGSRDTGRGLATAREVVSRPVSVTTNAHEGDSEGHSRHGGHGHLGGASQRESVRGNLTVNAKRSLSVEGIRISSAVARHGEAVKLVLATLAHEGAREGATLI